MVEEFEDVRAEGIRKFKTDRDTIPEYFREDTYLKQGILAEIIEYLANSDPKINEIVKKAREIQRGTINKPYSMQQAIIERRKMPRKTGNIFLGGRNRLDKEPEMKIASANLKVVKIDTNYLPHALPYEPPDYSDFVNWWDRFKNDNMIPVFLYANPAWYWDNPECIDEAGIHCDAFCASPAPDGKDKPFLAFKPQEHEKGSDISSLDFNAHARCSEGKYQSQQITNSAQWEFTFQPEEDEYVDIDIQNFLSGYCKWRADWNRFVWLQFSALLVVKKDTPDGDITCLTNFEQDCLSFSNNNILGGKEPPQGYFGYDPDDPQSYISFLPISINPRMCVEAGRRYDVYVKLDVRLSADPHTEINLGQDPYDSESKSVGPCRLRTKCRIWKTHSKC